MKIKTKSFSISTIVETSRLTTVNGYRKFSLLSFALVVLVFLNINVSAQTGFEPVEMKKQFAAESKQFDKMFNYENQLIFTYHKDVTVLDGKDITPGSKVLFMDKTTGETTVAPESLRNARHVYMYEGKLFYIIDTASIYSFDLKTSETKLLVQAHDRIINFYNMPKHRILVNARTGGSTTKPTVVGGDIERLAIYDYENGAVENVTDLPNIMQAFSVGNKIVFLESGYWFKKPGVSFRASVYDTETKMTYSRKDFLLLGLATPVTDSTFFMSFNPVGGGNDILSVVNINKDLHDATFEMDNLFEKGLKAPTIAGGIIDACSPIPYFINNEDAGFYWETNLKTNEVNNRSSDEVWSMNLTTLNFTFVGKFKDYDNDWSITDGYVVDERFVSPGNHWFYTNKLYGKTETGIVKNNTIPGVNVYPNPANNGVTTVQVPGNADVQIYSVDGRMTFSQKVSFGNTQVPVNTGTNVMRITIGTKTQTIKVIGY